MHPRYGVQPRSWAIDRSEYHPASTFKVTSRRLSITNSAFCTKSSCEGWLGLRLRLSCFQHHVVIQKRHNHYRSLLPAASIIICNSSFLKPPPLSHCFFTSSGTTTCGAFFLFLGLQKAAKRGIVASELAGRDADRLLVGRMWGLASIAVWVQ